MTPATTDVLPAVLSSSDQRTERDRIIHEVKERVIATQEGASAFNAMVNARRLFAFAGMHLVKIMEKKGIDPHKAFDLLVASSKAAAARDIDVRQLLDPFLQKNGTMEWLGDKVEAQVKDANDQAKQVKYAAEDERRKKPIPVGVEIDPIEGKKELPRGSTLVLHGPAGAVRSALDFIGDVAAAGGCRVIQLTSRASNAVSETSRKNVITVPANQWQQKGGNRRELATLLGEIIVPVHGDLLVIEDLHMLARPSHFGFKGGHVGAVAGDTHRDVRRLCQELGISLAAGVGKTDVSNEDDFDMATAGWEQLKQFSTLLPVIAEVEPGEIHFTVKVGSPPVPLTTINVEQYNLAHQNAPRIVRPS